MDKCTALFSLIVILHFFSDWALQTKSIARNKSKTYEYMLFHGAIVHTVFSVFAYFMDIPQTLVFLNTATHMGIDSVLWRGYIQVATLKGKTTDFYLEHNKYADDYWFYFCIAVDQTVHIVILFFLFGSYLY